MAPCAAPLQGHIGLLMLAPKLSSAPAAPRNEGAEAGGEPPFARSDGGCAVWAVSKTPVPYPAAAAFMETYARDVAAGAAEELVWLLEHPPVYTAGVSARPEDLLAPGRFPVFQSPRGGQMTYHGPGQRVVYVMLDLSRRRRDVRAFVEALEAWVIRTLEVFNVVGELRKGRVGVWVRRSDPPGREDKIAAVGVKIRRWVSFHGISLNVEPDLEHFSGIVPCGILDHGVTSLVDLGRPVVMDEVDAELRKAFASIFGPLREGPPPLLPPADGLRA